MRDTIFTSMRPSTHIRRLARADSALLEAHVRRLSPEDWIDLFGAGAPAINRYLAGIDLDRDIILAALGPDGSVRATARIRCDRGSSCAEILLARERDRVGAQLWEGTICAAVEAAIVARIRWLDVSSLGCDAETRHALERAGFRLSASEGGTAGELFFGKAGGMERSRRRG